MKNLDLFSRFENATYVILAYLSIWGVPLLAIFLVDTLFLKDLSPFIRYPLWGGLGIIGFGLGIAVSGYIEDFFSGIRKFFGMKPLNVLMDEINNEREKADLATDELKERWFTQLSDSKQRFILYKLQQQQIAKLNNFHSGIKIIIFLLIVILAFCGASRIL
jgi:hypothetical protein